MLAALAVAVCGATVVWSTVVLHMRIVIAHGVQNVAPSMAEKIYPPYADATVLSGDGDPDDPGDPGDDALAVPLSGSGWDSDTASILHVEDVAAEDARDTVEVLSANLWMMPFGIGRPASQKERTLKAFVAHVRDSRKTPEVVCVQEVWGAYSLRQARLVHALNDMGYSTFVPKPPALLDGRIMDSGLVIAVRGEIVGASFSPFPRSTCAQPDTLAQKGVSIVRARLHKNARAVTILNTHLQASYKINDAAGDDLRKHQLQHMLRALANFEHRRAADGGPQSRDYLDRHVDPLIMCGDFNMARIAERLRNSSILSDANEIETTTTYNCAAAISGELEMASSNPIHAVAQKMRQLKAKYTRLHPESIDHVVGIRGATVVRTEAVELRDEDTRDGELYTLSDHTMLASEVEFGRYTAFPGHA